MEPATPTAHAAAPRPGTTQGAEAVAALDLGTNNCRLLVARPAHAGFRVIEAFSRVVRLGEGLARTGRLSAPAVERGLAALGVCAGRMRRRGVTRSRAVATEACRRAENLPAFRDAVRERTGIELEVISPDEEARLALAGCAPLLDPLIPRALVFDIGGGSTELVWLRVAPDASGSSRVTGVIDSISLPFGVVSLAERYAGDPLCAPAYEAIVAETTDQCAAFEQRHGIRRRVAAGEVQMLGSSGTVTTVAGVAMRLPRYDRARVDGSVIDRAEAIAVSRGLLALDWDGRAAQPCIGRNRADLVMPGCAVLEAICRLWPVPNLGVADRGLREGIVLDLLAERAPPAG